MSIKKLTNKLLKDRKIENGRIVLFLVAVTYLKG